MLKMMVQSNYRPSLSGKLQNSDYQVIENSQSGFTSGVEEARFGSEYIGNEISERIFINWPSFLETIRGLLPPSLVEKVIHFVNAMYQRMLVQFQGVHFSDKSLIKPIIFEIGFENDIILRWGYMNSNVSIILNSEVATWAIQSDNQKSRFQFSLETYPIDLYLQSVKLLFERLSYLA